MNGPKKKKYLLDKYAQFPLAISNSENQIYKQITHEVIEKRAIRPLEFLDPSKLDDNDIKIEGEVYEWSENDTKFRVWFPIFPKDFEIKEDAKDCSIQMVAKKHASNWVTSPYDNNFSSLCQKGITREDIVEKAKEVTVKSCFIYFVATNVTTYSRYVQKSEIEIDSKLKCYPISCLAYKWTIYQRSKEDENNNDISLRTSWIMAYFEANSTDEDVCIFRHFNEEYGKIKE